MTFGAVMPKMRVVADYFESLPWMLRLLLVQMWQVAELARARTVAGYFGGDSQASDLVMLLV